MLISNESEIVIFSFIELMGVYKVLLEFDGVGLDIEEFLGVGVGFNGKELILCLIICVIIK